MLLDRYLFMALVRGVSLVFLVLIGLFSFFELAQQLNDVGKGSFETTDALRVVGFLLPRLSIDVLPVTCMLGCIIGLGSLAAKEEITIMRSSGVSVLRLTFPLLWLAGILIVAVVLLQQIVIPELSYQASLLRDKIFQTDGGNGQDYWTRSASNLIRVGRLEWGRIPRDIEIYELDKGMVKRIIKADRADVFRSNQWLLHDVTVTDFDRSGMKVRKTRQRAWRSDLSPSQISKFVIADIALSPFELYEYIQRLSRNGLDAHRYEVILWQQVGLPIGLIAMLLLGMPFIIGSFRVVPVGTRITLGSVIGVLFYLGQRIFIQFGLLYDLPASFIVLSPVCIMLFLAFWGILRAR